MFCSEAGAIFFFISQFRKSGSRNCLLLFFFPFFIRGFLVFWVARPVAHDRKGEQGRRGGAVTSPRRPKSSCPLASLG